ncbi:hypothetical protein CUMW_180490 [Citrus unshiu]|uniref:Knottin scorpion toxin-like domain-containing protein n=1 Tax=Citrus sinensis TaxID=2711 RepID=A0A067EU99_CITSI|nr:hypothetical protein CISIN_1g044065mg [Citrus sinensis]GAY57573.1 hypothetical protein CUMW_180490 [Citrus unshiu]
MAQSQTKVFSFIILAVLLLTIINCNEVSASKCCRNHPQLGNCVKGKDDQPNTGKCWKYCTTECKGCICKPVKSEHHCHCMC